MKINFLMHFFNPFAKKKPTGTNKVAGGRRWGRGKCNKFNLIYRIGLTLSSSRNNKDNNSNCK